MFIMFQDDVYATSTNISVLIEEGKKETSIGHWGSLGGLVN